MINRKLYIVGTQGIPAEYGGLETFAEQLSTRLAARGHSVCVTCETDTAKSTGASEYRGVELRHIEGPSNNLRTIVADLKALWSCYQTARPGDVVYLLGYGVGPFAWPVLKAIRGKEVQFWLNPDGLEWKRPRWPRWVQAYFWASEWFLVEQADRVICDSAAIADHHQCKWNLESEHTEVIEYGAPVIDRDALDTGLEARRNDYLAQYDLETKGYFTYVGRFVPDNNLDLLVRGVLDERINRRLLICASHDRSDPFYQKLQDWVRSSKTPEKVIFTGGIYDQPLLRALRLGAYAHLHGHEVGGTNPALVEAMGLGSLILALNTRFNREVLGRAGLYFGKSVEGLVRTLQLADRLSDTTIQEYQQRATERVRSHYNWPRIVDEYERRIWDTAARPSSGSELRPQGSAVRLDGPDER